MSILALEFSSEQRSVAVLPGNNAEAQPASSMTRTSPRTLNAFHLIEAALSEAKLEREHITCLVVGLGPGSYTGIRAAISIAQAWQLAHEIKLLGMGSVESLAVQAQGAGMLGRVSFIIDAQRNEFYLATYEIEPARLQLTEALHVATFAEVAGRVQAGHVIAGPEAARWFPNARSFFPEAGALARLAVGRRDFVAGEALEPIYLRETSFVKTAPPRTLPSVR